MLELTPCLMLFLGCVGGKLVLLPPPPTSAAPTAYSKLWEGSPARHSGAEPRQIQGRVAQPLPGVFTQLGAAWEEQLHLSVPRHREGVSTLTSWQTALC